MTRLTPVNPAEAKDSVKDTLDELAARGGALGPMVLTMANSSALLRGYADLNRAMKRSHLDRRIRSASRWRSRNGSAALDEDVETLRRHGYRDEQIADVVGLVALNVLTGAFNLVAGLEPSTALRSAA